MNTEASFRLASMTAVLKANKLLTAHRFGARISKATTKDGQGCVYTITVTGGSSTTAKALLRENGIMPL